MSIHSVRIIFSTRFLSDINLTDGTPDEALVNQTMRRFKTVKFSAITHVRTVDLETRSATALIRPKSFPDFCQISIS